MKHIIYFFLILFVARVANAETLFTACPQGSTMVTSNAIFLCSVRSYGDMGAITSCLSGDSVYYNLSSSYCGMFAATNMTFRDGGGTYVFTTACPME